MTTEKHQIDQLDHYITALQQGNEGGENPLIDDLFNLSESITATNAVKQKIEDTMSNNTIQYQPQRVVMKRLATIAAMLVITIGVTMSVPSLRSQAEQLFNLFTQGQTNVDPATHPTAEPPADASFIATPAPDNSQVGLTLAEVESAIANVPEITFNLQTPSVVPEGFTYHSGMVLPRGNMVSLHYACTDYLADFSLNIADLNNTSSSYAHPIGADATIEQVTVNGQAAEYVRGEFGLDGQWNSNLPIHILTWTANDTFYKVYARQQDGSACAIDRDTVLEIANSVK